jgi:hypothetical protein
MKEDLIKLLLDSNAIKSMLGEIIITAEHPNAPTSFTKILSRGIGRIENLMKVVITPLEPPDGLVESYLLLFQDHSSQHFQKVLELRVRI